MSAKNKINYQVVSVKSESNDVKTLTLEYPSGAHPNFIAGQYLNVYFPESGTPEGKAYTVSSAPSEKNFTLTVKAMGEFSNRLAALQPGDTLSGTEPYGYFYSEDTASPLFMIAGGIGVTPFRSMIFDITAKHPDRPVTLFYSARTVDEIIFKSELDTLAKSHPSFSVQYFVTREVVQVSNINSGRINAAAVTNSKPVPETEFFICGSISFVRDIRRDLCNHGIKEEMINTEAFFSH